MIGAKENGKVFSQDDIMKMLDSCYRKVLDGIPKVSPSIEQMANDYLEKNPSVPKAAEKMITNQVIKCTTSGALTGFGGLITLPVSVPANVSSVLYVQMRMIACTAYMGGYDLRSDQVQTLVYACLAGVTVNQFIKKTGVRVGEKVVRGMIQKIPGQVLTKINQKVGFRLITKFGEKGVINLGQLIPGVGAVIGGGLDLVETKSIGKRSYRWFIEGNFEESAEEKLVEEQN